MYDIIGKHKVCYIIDKHGIMIFNLLKQRWCSIVQQTLTTIDSFHDFIARHPLAIIHIMRDNCSVCHAVLPQIADIVKDFPNVPLGIVNQSELEEIAGELSIFTVPVDLIYLDGKEMHRQGRFIDMQQFEHQLNLMYQSLDN